ncbi:hypothetical protein [Marinicella meishanensis]|uniref:hypothetical protein n=1 Tax=Marinicella meishanensis TaxID=2873263 RepID=UPI001CBBB2D3|nr:hypothetical protein [Marinicella sp. NBU2979]
MFEWLKSVQYLVYSGLLLLVGSGTVKAERLLCMCCEPVDHLIEIEVASCHEVSVPDAAGLGHQQIMDLVIDGVKTSTVPYSNQVIGFEIHHDRHETELEVARTFVY